MDFTGVVPQAVKPAYTIIEPPLKCRFEKKKFVFSEVIVVMSKTIWSVEINFFSSENATFFPIETKKKVLFPSEFQSKLLLTFCKLWI